MKAVYYIAYHTDWGHVCPIVWKVLEEEGYLAEKSGVTTPDGKDVYKYVDEAGNEFHFVPTDKAVCLDYPKYLPFMKEYYSDFDVSGMVTWHEGAAAEPNVLTCHSIGDMDSGYFAPEKPRLMRNIMKGMRRQLDKVGLDEYRVHTEGTHWSGVHNGVGHPELIPEYPVPIMDLEVGSDESSWGDERACRALALSLMDIFTDDGRKLHNLMCVGGVHFDPNFAQAALTDFGDNEAFGVTHILANQWLVTGEYESEEGFQKAVNAVEAIEGGIDAVVMHDKAKACYKDLARNLAAKYGVPVFKHQRLRKPEGMEL